MLSSLGKRKRKNEKKEKERNTEGT